MKAALRFFKVTLIGGVIFLIPLAFLATILAKAHQIMLVVAEPVDDLIPAETVAGVALVRLLAWLAIPVACFFAGLAAQSQLGRSFGRAIDDRLLIVVPGYSALKGRVTGNIGSDADEIKLAPIVAKLDDTSQIAFEVERLDDGNVVVFMPGAPDPWAGSVVILTADRVVPLALDHRSAAATLKALGRGTGLALSARPAGVESCV